MTRHCLFGAAHIDRIGITSGEATPGHSNPGTMRETPGGAALNVASSLAALGASVSLSSAVGDDQAGARIKAEAATQKIDFTALASGAHPTATYTAILDSQGELITALSDMEIYAAVQVDTARVCADDWLLVDANFSDHAIAALLSKPAAHRAAMTVSAAKAGRLRPHLGALDLLLTNRAEAAVLCEAPADTPLADLAAKFATSGTSRAIITDGPRPISVLDGPNITAHPIPPCDVRSVTGAGDALAAGVLFALGRGDSFPTAIDTGIRAAQAILGSDGPYRADLAQAIGASP